MLRRGFSPHVSIPNHRIIFHLIYFWGAREPAADRGTAPSSAAGSGESPSWKKQEQEIPAGFQRAGLCSIFLKKGGQSLSVFILGAVRLRLLTRRLWPRGGRFFFGGGMTVGGGMGLWPSKEGSMALVV